MDVATLSEAPSPRPYAIGVKAEERARDPRGQPEDGEPTSSDTGADRRDEAGAERRETPVHERCIHHPNRTAVARCGACDEPVCLTCAVPVRGRVLGPECLAAELGDPAIATPSLDRTGAGPGAVVAIAGALLALLSTVGPWTRTGAGDRLLGAWVPSLRWSMAAALAAAALLPGAWWLRTHPARAGTIALLLGGSAIAVTSALAIAFPPTFQTASWGPWAAASGGVLVVAAAIANLIAEPRPGQGV